MVVISDVKIKSPLYMDVGPTLKQHWANAPFLLGTQGTSPSSHFAPHHIPLILIWLLLQPLLLLRVRHMQPSWTYVYVHEGCKRLTYIYVHEGCKRLTYIYVHEGCKRPTYIYVHEGCKRLTYIYVHGGCKRLTTQPYLFNITEFIAIFSPAFSFHYLATQTTLTGRSIRLWAYQIQ